MRLLTIAVLTIILGCQKVGITNAPETSRISSSEPGDSAVPIGLYTDEDIRRLTNVTIGDNDEEALLDVVPNGETLPRGEVFKRLHLDVSRFIEYRKELSNLVIYERWQVSPSFDLSCMNAINDEENEGLELSDSRRRVYGICIEKRKSN